MHVNLSIYGRAHEITLWNSVALFPEREIIKKIMKMQRPLSGQSISFFFWLKGFCLQPIHFHRKRAVIKNKMEAESNQPEE